MRISHVLPGSVAALGVTGLLLFSVVGHVQPTQPASPEVQILHHHVPPPVSSGTATVIGAVPSTQKLNFVIHLPVRNQAQLTELLKHLSDPASPDFRRWLSVADFTEQFGRTQQEYQKVVDFARGNGFAVRYTSLNRLMLVASGSAEQIEKAFHVRMKLYQHPTEDRTFYAPDQEPSVALDVPVSHISGLNNLYRPHPAVRRAQGGGGPAGTGSGPLNSFLGSDMRSAYNMGPNTGTGQAVGLVEFAGYAMSDIDLYFSRIQQSNTVPIVNVVVDGGSATNYTNPNDNDEVCLDIEQAASVAPGLSQLLVYIGPEDFGSGVDGVIFNRMATDNIAKQLSNSWWWYPDDPGTDEPYFQEMAAQGQSFFSISGDFGAYTGSDASDESYPGEDPYVTTVGGTHLTTNGAGGSWQSETVWNDGALASGGGPANDGATTFPIQTWQVPVLNSSNGGSSTTRNVPDVALEGDTDNFECSNSGQCLTNYGGTSAATPRWAAWMALVNQEMVAEGHAAGLGFINPALYAIGQSPAYNSDFHDITVGNNNTGRQSTFFEAVVGYDLTTGWGSMNGVNLMADLIAVGSSTFSLSSSPGQITVIAGNSANSTITVTTNGGFTDKVTLAASGLPSGVTAAFTTNPTASTSLLTLTASSAATAGTTTITVTGAAGGLTATTKLTLTIQPAPSFTLSDSPAALTLAAGSSGTSTITVIPTAGFTGKVSLSASGLPSGVIAAFAANPTTGGSLLTLSASSTAPTSTAVITITGTSGSLSATTQLAITIQAVPSFSLMDSAGALSIVAGSSGTSTVSVIPAGGFTGKVTLAASGLPNGVTAVFTTNPTTGTSVLTLSASSAATTGTTAITITGTSGGLTATTKLTVTVHPAPSFTLADSPGALSIVAGSSGTSTISVTPAGGFTGKVTLAASGLPSGVTAAFASNPTNGTSLLNLTVSSTAAPGTSTVTIAGASGSLMATIKLALTIQSFSLSDSAETLTMIRGGSATSTITVMPIAGFAGKVTLAASDLPSGVTATFATNPTLRSSLLMLKASPTATTGRATVTIRGTSGNLSQTTTLALTVQGFSLSESADSLAIPRDGSATSTITVVPVAGFSGKVALSASGLPSGVTATFGTNPTTETSVLTLKANATAPTGATIVTITGTSGALTESAKLTLTVQGFSLSESADSLAILRDGSATSTITIVPMAGFSGKVALSASGLPSGVTATFGANPTTERSVLTLRANATAPTGASTVTIIGTAGGLRETATLTLTVQSFSLSETASAVTITQGASGTDTVSVIPVSGFSGKVTLGAAGLPTGVTASFGTNPASKTSVLTLKADATATAGTATIMITGTSGSLTETTKLALTVQSFSLSDTLTVLRGSSTSSTISVRPLAGFAGKVTLAAPELPRGVTAVFATNPTTGSSLLTLRASATAPTGTTTVVITGTSGGITAVSRLPLTVLPQTVP